MSMIVVPLMSWGGLFTDQRLLGAAVLIFVAAAFVGVGVSRFVGRDRGPNFFGMLAALAFVAALAYAGVEAAGIVLWFLIALAAILGAFALVA